VIRAIVTDIEGTTSSLSFVKDELFPYARERLAGFVRAHADDTRVREALAEVAREAGRPLDVEGAIAQLLAWSDADRKVTPLKALQGMIWAVGYRDGTLKGHLYADSVDALRRWRARGLVLYVFSSGSVPAQKLLFGHTAFGDLTPLFSGYFDTRIGSKVEAASYARIAQEAGMAPREMLFLSDVAAELDAARAAGFDTVLVVRDGPFDANAGHRQVRDLSEVE